MKNEDLKQIYDSQELKFHSGYNESMMIVKMLDSWQGLDVLEIGCGHGHLASILSYAGANVIGVDYSLEQMAIAKNKYPGMKFIQILNLASLGTLEDGFQAAGGVGKPWDVVVMQGVLEHLDEPWAELDKIMEQLLKPQGACCLSVPHWVNPRGYIYHTLRLLFNAKMSLTDLHYFLPGDFLKYCKTDTEYFKYEKGYGCQFYHCDESWASGPEMLADFKKRLPKVFDQGPTSQMPAKIDNFLKFLEKMLPDIPKGEGACLGVKISK